jgi:hypothetical protein
MGLYLSVGGFTTSAANQTLYWTIGWPGNAYQGPIGVSSNFEGAEDNYGTVTTVQTSVNAFYDDSEGYYWPTGINYTAELRNDSDWPVIYNLSIGTF